MKAKKYFGQNFLKEDTIIKTIVSLFDVEKEDLIIEIGPGRGALTKELVKLPSKLFCIEIDKDMKQYLNKLESDKCHIIYEDILSCNLNEIIEKEYCNNIYIVGNLPYYITNPIIEYLVKTDVSINKMAFMVQKEVADRYTSLPGHREYGYMTVFLNHFYDIRKVVDANRKYFDPIPGVDSAVIELTRKEDIINADEEYFEFVKNCFHLKRKNIKNNLNEYPIDKLNAILEKYGFDSSNRAEEFPEEVFMDLYKEIL